VLVFDGLALLVGAGLPISLDAPRHAFAVGLIALLICGVAPRMLPGFSGGRIRSPRLVAATLWLGNVATVLRVCPVALAPLLDRLGAAGGNIAAIAFGFSGPFGLALAIVLAVNLWPAIWPRQTAQATS
jgi:uncharacterized protein involved in response to NO